MKFIDKLLGVICNIVIILYTGEISKWINMCTV